jgi:hypothetical protein
MNWYFLRDGGQVGPMAWADLWRCGQSGELRPADLVWRDGMPEWRTAASVPGLFPAPQPVPAAAPVPQKTYAPAPQAAPAPQSAPQPQAAPYRQAAAPQPQFQGAQVVPPRSSGDDPFMRWLLPVGRSMWAIMAGYFGLLSVLIVFAPLALATGIFAVIDIKRNPNKHGMGRAIFGIIMGAVFSVILVVMLVAWMTERP